MMRNLLKTAYFLCQNVANVNVTSIRFAGHSKWQNIKHIKATKDAERGQLFTKLGRQMKVAITEGGSVDPKHNLKLYQVIEQAKRVNMPVATIQSILKSSQSDKTGSKAHIIEIKGPGSCIIMCEVYTNNLQMVKQNMATILKKTGSKFGDGGGVHVFEEKGFIVTEILPELAGKSEEEILEAATDHAIESGAEDVKIAEENTLHFICGKTNLNSVVTGLEKIKYKIKSADVEYSPHKVQPLQDSELQMCENLYERLQNLPEVVKLSDNIA